MISMPKIGRIVDGILRNDVHYWPLKQLNIPGVSVFTYGENTLRLLMGLTFECNGCGNCCTESKDGACEEKRENSCGIKNGMPLNCRTYPFAMPEKLVILHDSNDGYIDSHFGQKVVYKNNVRYDFSLYTGLTLVLDDICPGWQRGDKMVKEHGRDVVAEIQGDKGYCVLPKFKGRMKNDEEASRAMLGILQESLKTEGLDAGRLFCDVWETPPLRKVYLSDCIPPKCPVDVVWGMSPSAKVSRKKRFLRGEDLEKFEFVLMSGSDADAMRKKDGKKKLQQNNNL